MSTRFTEGGAAGVATASTLAPGIIEIATNAEATTGTSTDRAVTPYQLANFAGGITGALVYRGSYNPVTALPDVSNASKGDFYLISADGTAAGVAVKTGDHLVFKQDAGGTLDSGDFDVVDNSESTDILRDGDLGSTVQAHGVILDNLSGLTLSNGDLIKATGVNSFTAVPSSGFQPASTTLTDIDAFAAPAQDSLVQFDAGGGLTLIDKSTVSGAAALNDLSDVTLTNPAANHFVVYNGTLNGFHNEAPSDARSSLGLGSAALSDAADFQPTSTTLTDIDAFAAPAQDSLVQFDAGGGLTLIDKSTVGGSATGALIYRGTVTVSGSTTPPAAITGASKGDFFIVSGEGYYSVASSKLLRDGDHIVFNQDVGGSLTAAKFDVIDNTGLFDKVVQHSGTTHSLDSRRVYTYSSAPNGATTFTLPDSSSLVSGDMIKLAWANTTQNSKHELSVTFAGGVGKPGLEHRAYGVSTTFNANTAGVSAVIKTRGQSITLIYDETLDKFMVEMGTHFLGQLLDLDLDTSAPASGEFLKYDGTNWISEQIASGDVSGLGTAATAAATDFLAVANNLSDLGDAATARTNLNLGTAATAAATDFLAAANNLSDVANAGTARTNLGLGTAATAATTDFLSGTGADTLGGNLDVGSSSIVSSGAANIAITPDSTGSIVLDGLNWPQADGSADQVLKTDGAGQLSFVDQSGGGSRPTVTTDNTGTDSTILNPAASDLEDIYLVDNGAAAVNITLPAVGSNSGYKVQVKRLGTANVTVTPASGTIDGAANKVLSVQYASFTCVTDGTDWYII